MLFLYACVCVVQIIIGRKKHTSTLIYIHAHKRICLNLLLLKARQITKRARSISTVYFFFISMFVCEYVCVREVFPAGGDARTDVLESQALTECWWWNWNQQQQHATPESATTTTLSHARAHNRVYSEKSAVHVVCYRA